MTFGVARASVIGGIHPPTAPASVTLADNDNVGQVVVDWTPGPGWVNIVDYTISWYDGGVLQGSVTTTNKPHTLSLTAGQKYTFRVSARSLAGQGLESADSQLWRVANAVAFLSSGTFTAPISKTYKFHIVGGGGGGGSDGDSDGHGSGGGAGYYNIRSQPMTAGQQMSCNVGAAGGGAAAGGTSSINFVSQGTLASSSGGGGGTRSNAPNGGSGAGAGRRSAGGGGNGGRGGTAGNTNTQGNFTGGQGQLGLPYGATSGRDDRIPSAGSGSYSTSNITYGGIYGYGAGYGGGSDRKGTGRGCGSGGATWSEPTNAGVAGMIIVFG